MNLTAKEISYLYICKRKLWLFAHGIRPELECSNVQIGISLQNSVFVRQDKEIPLGMNGVLDWADFPDGIIHETKKGRSPNAADEAQVRFYLWILRQNGVSVREAQIHYPLIRKVVYVQWNASTESAAEQDIADTQAVIDLLRPPLLQRKNICKSCAYEEVCFA